MLIVCTGMDNTGKTTLVEELTHNIVSIMKGFKVIKTKSPGPIEKSKQVEWVESTLELANEPGVIVISDRFPLIEELVYGHVLRTPVFDLVEDNELYQKFKESSPLLIYTRPDEEVIFNFGDRPQMEGVIEKKNTLLKRFDVVMEFLRKRLNIMGVDYDYTKRDTDHDMVWDSMDNPLHIILMSEMVDKIHDELTNNWVKFPKEKKKKSKNIVGEEK